MEEKTGYMTTGKATARGIQDKMPEERNG